MEPGDAVFVSGKLGKFHKAVGVLSRTLGSILLLGMSAAAISGGEDTNWAGAGVGIAVGLYLTVTGGAASRIFKYADATEKRRARVVQWFNWLSVLLFVAAVAFLIGNIIDNDLYRKLGMNF